MYFEWNSQIELGYPPIDEQHRRLFALSEEVARTLADSADHRPAAGALRELSDFVREHFAFEEGLMRVNGYPGADGHAGAHNLLLTELETYCRKLQTDEQANLTVTGLVAFLWHWLIMHINAADRELVRWVKSGGAPR